MFKYLVLATLATTIFVFLFYRGMYIVNRRRARYSAYGDAVYESVSAHFEELKRKESELSGTEEYGVKDSSRWLAEVNRFVSSVVPSKLPKRVLSQLKNGPRGYKTEYFTFAVNYTLDLLCFGKIPEKDYSTVIEGIEDVYQNTIVPGHLAALNKSKIVTGALGSMLAFVLLLPSEPAQAAPAGFSPFDACNVLIEEPGFSPNESGYSHQYDDVYGCATPYKDLGKSALSNNISLYGKGTKDEVTKVRLLLNVNVKQNASKDLKYLSTLCVKMATGLLGGTAPELSSKVPAGAPFSVVFNGYSVRLDKEVWPTGKGLEYSCVISVDRKGAAQ